MIQYKAKAFDADMVFSDMPVSVGSWPKGGGGESFKWRKWSFFIPMCRSKFSRLWFNPYSVVMS